MKVETIRVSAASKLGWIKAQQEKMTGQERESPREYIERESHYVWGRRYLLKIVERDSVPQVLLRHKTIVPQVRPGTSAERRQEVFDEWYRAQLRVAVQPLIAKGNRRWASKWDVFSFRG
jgi:predicted metal-dependent hydrolase